MSSPPESNIRMREWLGIANAVRWQVPAIRYVAVLITITSSLLLGCQSLPTDRAPLIEGVVWQLDNETTDVHGNWHEIGADNLLIQWISVDGIHFMHNQKNTLTHRQPDWHRIGSEPWAHKVILGLAGRFDESTARSDIAGLITESARLAKLPTALNVVGWYFPVEVDSSWDDAKKLGLQLADLPRPLWISIYDGRNIGAAPFAQWLSTWLPADVGVFFQDGVGVHARTAPVARQYAEEILHQLGASRVKIIAEAFRPKPEGGFRSATLDELSAQLISYRGLPVYLFDGPHYVSNELVEGLKRKFNK